MRKSLAVVLLVAGAAFGETPASLQYRFQNGQTYAYEVKIVAELPEETQTLAGVSRYTVKGVDGESGQITLTQSAGLSMKHDPKQAERTAGRFPRPPRIMPMMDFTNYNSPSDVVIDRSGRVVRYQRKSQLPFMLGNSWALLIEPLPAEGQTQWQVSNDMEITRTEISRFGPFRGETQQGSNQEAKQTVDYTLAGNDGKIATIHRTYDLQTLEKVENAPVLEQSGTGDLHFDVAEGVMRDIDEKYTLQINKPGATVKIPVSVTARLLSPEEAAKREEERKQAAERFKAQIAERDKPKAVDESTLDECLGKLKKSAGQIVAAEEELARMAPIESRREEVAARLAELLTDREEMVQSSAAKALKTWVTPKQVPTLIEALESENTFLRQYAIAALGASKDPRAAAAVAPLLAIFRDQTEAGKALKSIGPAAEQDVQAVLKNREWSVRLAAVEVLGEIGTEKSTAALKAVAGRDSNRIVQMKAKEALQAIAGRQGTPATTK